jgi:hypothetical protein
VACGLQSRFHALHPFGQNLMFGSTHLGDTVLAVEKRASIVRASACPGALWGSCGNAILDSFISTPKAL